MTDVLIHTIEARDNLLLALIQDHFSLNEENTRRVIINAARETETALRERGVNYPDLARALTPSTSFRIFAQTSKTEA